jgi:RNA polymerase sigma factor (sigma-70 family)
MSRKWTDRELYEACGQNGSEQQRSAFDLLYQELYAVSLFMLQTTLAPEPRALAQDCAQEAVVKIWKHLATCTQPDTMRSWAKSIVRNQTLNEIAKLKRKATDSLEEHTDKLLLDERTTLLETFQAKEKYNAILDLLIAAPLSERSRYVILAKYLLQMTEEEISQALSQKEGNVVKPSHVQVTRAKNFKKIYSDPELYKKFRDLREDDDSA